jgi:hypothetical protein
VLVDTYSPEELLHRLALSLPQQEGKGRDGLLETVQSVLKYSVNTWDQGFLDKLYSNTNAVFSPCPPGFRRAELWTDAVRLTHVTGRRDIRATPLGAQH